MLFSDKTVMKESLYLSKKISELTERVVFLKKRIVILENENEILRKRLSKKSSWFSKLKKLLTGKITLEIVMPWSDKKEERSLSQEENIEEKIRKVS